MNVEPYSNGLSPESIASLLSPFKNTPVTVAFSGGVDSTVLLHLLVALRDLGRLEHVDAIHVHHGLSSLADQWTDFCESICEQWRVPLTLARVSVPDNTGEGVEQAARHLRYECFEQKLVDGGCLVMGHHRDDQAETVLLRLFRGTGLDGLSGIPQKRNLGEGVLLRPLLHVSRRSIEAYACDHQLKWIEDDSNKDERFSRNFLRQTIIPQIEQRWPGASQRMALLTDEIGEVKEQVQSQLAKALRQCQRMGVGWWSDGRTLLSLNAFRQFDIVLQKQVLRLWLKNNTGTVPGRDQLGKLFKELMSAREDAEPQMKMGVFIIRRFRDDLYVTSAAEVQSYEIQQWEWPDNNSIHLKDGLEIGVDTASVEAGAKVILPNKSLQILRRDHITGSEKIAVAGRHGRKTLKRWLQDYNVPPWLRHRQPFIYDGENMVAAPGLWICPAYLGEGEGHSLICIDTKVLHKS